LFNGRITSAIFHNRIADIFAERFAGDGNAIQVQRAGLAGQRFEDGADAAGAEHIFHVVFPSRCNFADVWHPRADFIQMCQREWLARFDRHRKRMQHGVGAAAHGDIERERIFKRLAGEDIAGANVLGNQIDDASAGFLEECIACRIGRQDAAVAGQG